MTALFFTSASGWFASILICIAILTPYAVRRNWFSEAIGAQIDSNSPLLTRLCPHYRIGYIVAGLSFAHAWVPMRSGYMKRTDMLGLWFATFALLLLFLQVLVGWTLRSPQIQSRRSLRRLHFWGMAATVALVAAHIWRNAH